MKIIHCTFMYISCIGMLKPACSTQGDVNLINLFKPFHTNVWARVCTFSLHVQEKSRDQLVERIDYSLKSRNHHALYTPTPTDRWYIIRYYTSTFLSLPVMVTFFIREILGLQIILNWIWNSVSVDHWSLTALWPSGLKIDLLSPWSLHLIKVNTPSKVLKYKN